MPIPVQCPNCKHTFAFKQPVRLLTWETIHKWLDGPVRTGDIGLLNRRRRVPKSQRPAGRMTERQKEDLERLYYQKLNSINAQVKMVGMTPKRLQMYKMQLRGICVAIILYGDKMKQGNRARMVYRMKAKCRKHREIRMRLEAESKITEALKKELKPVGEAYAKNLGYASVDRLEGV